MYRLYAILLSSFFLCISCEDTDNGPSKRGEITVSSEIFGSSVYYVNGYSFEEEKFVPTMNPGSSVSDIIPQRVLQVSGEVIGMVFSAGPGNPYGFYKNFESQNPAEAEQFFSGYTQVSVGDLESLTDTLKAGQVYTFRTYKDNYVKILIKEVRLMTGSALSDYAEADIKYYIQRDGAPVFEE